MKKISANLGTIACIFGAALIAQGNHVNAAPYFKGKTIDLIVGFSVGGGSDLAARVIANNLGRHIEGNPTIVVKNLTGQGSVKAANFMYEKAKPNGQTVFFGPWYLLSQKMKVRGMRVKYDELTLISPSRSPGGYVTYMRKDAVPGGYKSPKDVLKAKRLRIAGVAPTSSVDRRLQLSFTLLGVNQRHVTGFRGLRRASASVRNGEMQASALALSAYNKSVVPNMVKPGIVVPLFYWALEDDNGNAQKNPIMAEGVPTFREFYKSVRGKAPSGDVWETFRLANNVAEVATHNLFGPPKMDPKVVAILRKGFIATLKDPVYIKQAQKVATYAHELVTLDRAANLLKSIPSAKQKNLDILSGISNPERKKRAKKKSK